LFKTEKKPFNMTYRPLPDRTLTPVKGDLKKQHCMFFMCDIQERFRPVILHFDSVIENARRLATASQILDIPLVVTEQYPKGLGKTVSEIPIDHAKIVKEKTRFTMLVDDVELAMEDYWSHKTPGLQIVVFGVETHVCVQQTVLDLLKRDKEVFVVADASSSRTRADRTFALQRLRDAGAIITTTESVLFQCIGHKDHDKFKDIQALIKSLPPDCGL